LLQPDFGTDGRIYERPADCHGPDSRVDCLQRLQEVRRVHDADQDDAVDDGTAAGRHDIVCRSWNRSGSEYRYATRDQSTRKEVKLKQRTTSHPLIAKRQPLLAQLAAVGVSERRV